MSRLLTAVAAALSLSAAVDASGQTASGAPTFDLLRSAHAADSLRTVAARQQSALARSAQANVAKSDTIARLRRELAALSASRTRADSLATAPTRVDLPLAAAAPVRVSPPPAPHDSAVTRVTPVARVVPAAAAAAPPAPVAAPAPAVRAQSPTVTGMLQLWLAAGDAGYRSTYRVRRAEVRGTGPIAPRVGWTVMLDLAKALSVAGGATGSSPAVAQSSRVLQDASVALQLHPRLRLDVGQQKIPFGIEGFQSSGSLITVERALFASDRARGGSFGDMRDVGVAARGRLGRSFDYNLGAFNGSGESQNDVDGNLAKSVVAHLAYRFGDRLLIGASGVAAGRGAGDAPVRDRAGVELRLQQGRLLLQGEGVTGRDGALTRRGFYAHGGVRVRPALDVHARFDSWDPDAAREADAASATERDYLLGATWSVPGTAALKVQADAVRRTYSAALLPDRSQLLVNLQANW